MDISLILGIVFVVAVFVTLVVFLVKGIKQGFLKTVIDFGISLASLAIAVFSAKPLLWLFDRFYKFSATFFDRFMLAFVKIPMMNQAVDSSTLGAQIATFESTEVTMSPWLKSFLIKIFNNTQLYEGETTTLATIGSNALSYILMLVLIILTFFITLKIVIYMLVPKIEDIKSTKKPISKLGGAFFGIANAVIFIFVGMAFFAVLPLGADDTTISDSIEKTVVIQPAFDFSQNIATNYFSGNINWTSQNKGFTTLQEDLVASYMSKSNEKDEEYIVTITLSNTLQITEKIYSKITYNYVVNTQSRYIFANNKLWIFDDANSFVKTINVYAKAKAVLYENQIDNGDETFTHYKSFLFLVE